VIDDHWTDEELKALDGLGCFPTARQYAIGIIARLRKEHGEVVQICGPMTTGGLGSLERNMDRFGHAIAQARINGRRVFNQMPFQSVIIRITNHHDGGKYRYDILTDFYEWLFRSGHLTHALFLPGWEDSVGARIERGYAKQYGVCIEECPPEWLLEPAE
jgi:hypothetical protein